VQYLRALGYETELVGPLESIDPRIASHADLQLCRLGCRDDAPVIRATDLERAAICGEYPRDIPFNVACTGKFFIHNLKYSNPRLLEAARGAGMTLIDVPQGYTKCSVVVVDENSIITYDRGIASACDSHNTNTAPAEPLNVLLIEPGQVELPGYDTGFIGGASGRIGNTIIFCGDITAHTDADAIIQFIKNRGLEIKYFDFPLLDIGSII